jgi:hypothetical protein
VGLDEGKLAEFASEEKVLLLAKQLIGAGKELPNQILAGLKRLELEGSLTKHPGRDLYRMTEPDHLRRR